jgi:hypothetical protein
MPNSHGAFVWFELLTTDTAASAAFYHKVLGWSERDSGTPDIAYTLFSANSADVAGMMTLPNEAAGAGAGPFWTGYIGANDVDATTEQVRARGGAVHRPPADIPGVGRFSIVADPAGATFALFKGAGDPPAPTAPDAPGTVGWRELYTNDVETAFAFYANLFGWTKGEAMDMGDMGVYQIFSRDGAMMGGMMRKPPNLPRPCWNFYFNLEAIDAGVDRVTSGGGRLFRGPQQVPGGSWIAQCGDPQGAFFALVAPKR